MPLLIVSGFPCSGKTHRSRQIIQDFQARIDRDPAHSRTKLHLINDESLGLSRDVYHAARPEKDARAAQMSAVKRSLGRDDIVIADGMNYIKGFRYQLFCEAKALRTPSCVVGTPIDQCRTYHRSRLEADPTSAYSDEDFENLVYRYEEPNGMTRWDSPLFTVPHDDHAPPLDAIWDAIFPAPSTSTAKGGRSVVVRPNAATVLPQASASDFLYALDKATTEVVTAVQRWQGDRVGLGDDEAGGEVDIEGADAKLVLPAGRKLTLAEMQRVRRAFIALMRQQGTEAGSGMDRVGKARVKAAFVAYLNDRWERE